MGQCMAIYLFIELKLEFKIVNFGARLKSLQVAIKLVLRSFPRYHIHHQFKLLFVKISTFTA